MSECDFIDVWRIFNPELKRNTWRRRKPEIKCRLDYFLASSSIVNKTEKNIGVSRGTKLHGVNCYSALIRSLLAASFLFLA